MTVEETPRTMISLLCPLLYLIIFTPLLTEDRLKQRESGEIPAKGEQALLSPDLREAHDPNGRGLKAGSLFQTTFQILWVKRPLAQGETFEAILSLRNREGKYNLLVELLSGNSPMPIRVAIFMGKTKVDKFYVVRKAIVNVFLRDKQVGRNEPMITFYSDRLEILSKGTLAPSRAKSGFFKGHPALVNKKLSEKSLQLHISEKTGRGAPVVTSKYSEKAYMFEDDGILVTIPFNFIHEVSDKSLSKNPTPQHKFIQTPRLFPQTAFRKRIGAMV